MGYEDFSVGYTEFDADGKITVTAPKVAFATYERDDDGHIYSGDLGATTDFEWWFDVQVSAVEAGDADTRQCISALIMFAAGNGQTELQNQLGVKFNQNGATDDQYKWIIRQHDGGLWGASATGAAFKSAGASTVYCRFLRSGNTATFDVYSTANLRVAGGNGDVEHLTTGGITATAYRYVHVALMRSNATDGSDHISGYVENLDLDPYAVAAGVAGSIVSRVVELITE